MKIYGVALLAGCYLAGHILGDFLGRLFHLSGNLGGVGFAMLLLVLIHDKSTRKGWLSAESEAAISGGWIALLVGIIATVACYACIPLLDNMYRKKNQQLS